MRRHLRRRDRAPQVVHARALGEQRQRERVDRQARQPDQAEPAEAGDERAGAEAQQQLPVAAQLAAPMPSTCPSTRRPNVNGCSPTRRPGVRTRISSRILKPSGRERRVRSSFATADAEESGQRIGDAGQASGEEQPRAAPISAGDTSVAHAGEAALALPGSGTGSPARGRGRSPRRGRAAQATSSGGCWRSPSMTMAQRRFAWLRGPRGPRRRARRRRSPAGARNQADPDRGALSRPSRSRCGVSSSESSTKMISALDALRAPPGSSTRGADVAGLVPCRHDRPQESDRQARAETVSMDCSLRRGCYWTNARSRRDVGWSLIISAYAEP